MKTFKSIIYWLGFFLIGWAFYSAIIFGIIFLIKFSIVFIQGSAIAAAWYSLIARISLVAAFWLAAIVLLHVAINRPQRSE